MIFAAYFAPWIAPRATPARRAPTSCRRRRTRSGGPLTVRSGSTTTRPDRSTSVPPHWSATILPSGLAATPADHTFAGAVDAAFLAVSLFLTTMPHVVDIGDHRVRGWTSTPIFQPALRLHAEVLPIGDSTNGDRQQHHPALGGSMVRNAPGRVRWASSTICPANSPRWAAADHDERQPPGPLGGRW